MQIEIFNGYYDRSNVKRDTKTMYLFTDNWNRTSGGGIIPKSSWYHQKYGRVKKDLNYPKMTQAVLRGLDNAFPLSTMVDQFKTQFSDNDYDEFVVILDSEIDEIYRNIHRFSKLVYCPNLGHGKISNMPKYAPRCYQYLISEFDKMILEFKNREN